MAVAPHRTPLAEDRANDATALLIVDMISTWQFPDAEQLIGQAAAIAPAIDALKRRCRKAGVPVVYVNDNRGRWRSDFRSLVGEARQQGGAAAAITQRIEPDEDDYFVLKPKHSGFFATPLDLLLRHLRVWRVLVTGVSGDQCIVMTASEARMRDYEVLVPADCTASMTAERNAQALAHLRDAFGIKTPLSTRVRLPPAARASARAG